jgi:hypothetical protein
MIEQLVKGNTLPPGVNRRRGRPRHRRIESQSIDRGPRRRVRLNRPRSEKLSNFKLGINYAK